MRKINFLDVTIAILLAFFVQSCSTVPLTSRNQVNLLPESNLVENDMPNAWCMLGGKVVVSSGILPLTKTESGLAVVMGHEVAHAVARHGNERMSHSMLVQMGGIALGEAPEGKAE